MMRRSIIRFTAVILSLFMVISGPLSLYARAEDEVILIDEEETEEPLPEAGEEAAYAPLRMEDIVFGEEHVIGDTPSFEEDAANVPEAAEAIRNNKIWVAGLAKYYPYTGSEVRPEVRVYLGRKLLTPDVDYSLSYANNISVSSETEPAVLKIHGKGNISGSASLNFGILSENFTLGRTPLSSVQIEMVQGKLSYDGTEQTPEWLLTDPAGFVLTPDDYDIFGDVSATLPGKYTVIFKGKGLYSGSSSFSYKIVGKKTLTEENLEAVINGGETVSYNSAGAKPEVELSCDGEPMQEGSDYILTYKRNKKAGDDAYIIVRGRGRFKGTVKLPFTIAPCDFATLDLLITDRVASPVKPEDYKNAELIFRTSEGELQTLKEGRDYLTDFSVIDGDPQQPGALISVIITPQGENYCGNDLYGTYQIISEEADFSRFEPEVDKDYVWTGGEIIPSHKHIRVSVSDDVITDYRVVACYNNVELGKAELLLAGTEPYCGYLSTEFSIVPASVGSLWGMEERYIQIPEPSAEKPRQAFDIEVPERYLDVQELGALPNDGIDDTEAINEAIVMAAGNPDYDSTVYIPAGIYDVSVGDRDAVIYISHYFIGDKGVNLVMDGNAILKLAPSNRTEYHLIFMNAYNISVTGGQLVGDKWYHDNAEVPDGIITGGNGITIDRGHCTVDRVQIYDNWCDGIYINDGGNRDENGEHYCTDIQIRGCDISYNNRNNISVIRGDNILVEDCDIYGAGPAAPAAGVDIEPDLAADAPEEKFDKMLCYDITFRNCNIAALEDKPAEGEGKWVRYFAFEINGYYRREVARAIYLENCRIYGDFLYGSCLKEELGLYDTAIIGKVYEPSFSE
ncbi:MAG: right-handed parallel beta-helix repeat-containing protein [Lachnospiraceae bacterium]|nr:right-handed parallel beta-helix repeat-containing protein [Lachnospiraceae bacterium]